MLSIIKLRLIHLKHEYMIVVVMTLMSLVLTFVMGAAQNGDYRSNILIVDEDNSDYSSLLIDEIMKNDSFKFEITDYNEALSEVNSEKALTAIVINKGFFKDIRNEISPTIKIIKVKDDMEIYTLQSLINSTSNNMIGNIKIANFTTEYISNINNDIDKTSLFEKTYEKLSYKIKKYKPINTSINFLNSSGTYDNLKHTVIGFSIFFSMYTMVFSVGDILNDKKYKTWQRILISPVSNSSLLGGSLVVSYIVGFLQLGILILSGKYIFNVDWGNSILGILLIAASFVFTVTSLGLFLSGIVKTHAQLSSITPVILTSTAMLGGSMWPLEIVNNKMLLLLSNFTPQKWAIVGMEKIAMYGGGFKVAILPSLILISMGIVLLTIGVKLVKFE